MSNTLSFLIDSTLSGVRSNLDPIHDLLIDRLEFYRSSIENSLDKGTEGILQIGEYVVSQTELYAKFNGLDWQYDVSEILDPVKILDMSQISSLWTSTTSYGLNTFHYVINMIAQDLGIVITGDNYVDILSAELYPYFRKRMNVGYDAFKAAFENPTGSSFSYIRNDLKAAIREWILTNKSMYIPGSIHNDDDFLSYYLTSQLNFDGLVACRNYLGELRFISLEALATQIGGTIASNEIIIKLSELLTQYQDTPANAIDALHNWAVLQYGVSNAQVQSILTTIDECARRYDSFGPKAIFMSVMNVFFSNKTSESTDDTVVAKSDVTNYTGVSPLAAVSSYAYKAYTATVTAIQHLNWNNILLAVKDTYVNSWKLMLQVSAAELNLVKRGVKWVKEKATTLFINPIDVQFQDQYEEATLDSGYYRVCVDSSTATNLKAKLMEREGLMMRLDCVGCIMYLCYSDRYNYGDLTGKHYFALIKPVTLENSGLVVSDAMQGIDYNTTSLSQGGCISQTPSDTNTEAKFVTNLAMSVLVSPLWIYALTDGISDALAWYRDTVYVDTTTFADYANNATSKTLSQWTSVHSVTNADLYNVATYNVLATVPNNALDKAIYHTMHKLDDRMQGSSTDFIPYTWVLTPYASAWRLVSDAEHNNEALKALKIMAVAAAAIIVATQVPKLIGGVKRKLFSIQNNADILAFGEDPSKVDIEKAYLASRKARFMNALVGNAPAAGADVFSATIAAVRGSNNASTSPDITLNDIYEVLIGQRK